MANKLSAARMRAESECGLNTRNPPSDHALGVLRNCPMPAQEMNFTVRNKLLAFGLIRLEDRPSPYKTHKAGATVAYAIPTGKAI